MRLRDYQRAIAAAPTWPLPWRFGMLNEWAIVTARSLCVAVSADGPSNRAAGAIGALGAKQHLQSRIEHSDATLPPFVAAA